MRFRRNSTSSQPSIGREHHHGASRPTSAALLILALVSLPTSAATLHYDAYLSGIPVGSAVVEIDLDVHAYRISGVAHSLGVAHLFSDWRSDFLAAGHLQDHIPMLTAYAYDERESTKRRVLWLTDGKVRHVKNDQVRPAHPVRSGADILTAFFLQADCWREKTLHTGRFDYRIRGRPSSRAGGCYFELQDSDGDRSRFHVRFGRHQGLRVPIEASTRGLLRGRIKLRTARGARATEPDVLMANSAGR
jgi:hypothetical protein